MASREPCPICHSCETRIEGPFSPPRSPQPVTVSVCSDCGHAVRAEYRDHAANLALQQSYFDDKAIRPDLRRTRWPHRSALVAAEVRRLGFTEGRALDIGCSTGTWLQTLGSAWQKHGVELSPSAARIAEEVSGAEVFCGPLESYEAASGSFDLITAFAVIDHLTDPRWMVRWVREHLRPAGLFVVMTGDRESGFAARLGTQWKMYRPLEHAHFFSSRSLVHLLESEGLMTRRKEWRPTRRELKPATRRLLSDLSEVLRRVTRPEYDHLYVYATGPQ